MTDIFQKFHYRHHSPSAVQKPLEIDIFQKVLRARGASLQFGSPVAVGRAVEDYVSASVIDGQGASDALRHAMTALDAHEAVAWDLEGDQQRLDWGAIGISSSPSLWRPLRASGRSSRRKTGKSDVGNTTKTLMLEAD